MIETYTDTDAAFLRQLVLPEDDHYRKDEAPIQRARVLFAGSLCRPQPNSCVHPVMISAPAPLLVTSGLRLSYYISDGLITIYDFILRIYFGQTSGCGLLANVGLSSRPSTVNFGQLRMGRHRPQLKSETARRWNKPSRPASAADVLRRPRCPSRGGK